MSVLEDVLEEEYSRSKRISQLIESELENLPKGSIRERTIKGRAYYYLNHREGKRVLSDYIKAEEVEELQKKIARRKELESTLKEQVNSQKMIEKALRKRLKK